MTGKQIAKNLRGSRRKWGIRALFDAGEKTYCVLGIKAVEKGVSNDVLQWFEGEAELSFADFAGLEDLTIINDGAESKRKLISQLESPSFAKTRYDVEGFVKYLKEEEAQRKKRHLEKEDNF